MKDFEEANVVDDETKMGNNKRPRISRRNIHGKGVAVGALFLIFGILLLLKYLGVFEGTPFESLIISWQSLILVIGLLFVFAYNYVSRLFGFVLMLTGTYFMIVEIYNLPADQQELYWPFLLIFLGVVILSRRLFGYNHNKMRNGHKMDFVNSFGVFGGGRKKVYSKNFKGGNVISIFGGTEINLISAELEDGINIIDIGIYFGGVSFKIPNDWHVQDEVLSVFGGFKDRRPGKDIMAVNSDKILVIRGFICCGGGEIKAI